MRINEGGSGGFGGDIDGIGGLVRGFGGAGLGWFVVARIRITLVRGFSGLGAAFELGSGMEFGRLGSWIVKWYGYADVRDKGELSVERGCQLVWVWVGTNHDSRLRRNAIFVATLDSGSRPE